MTTQPPDKPRSDQPVPGAVGPEDEPQPVAERPAGSGPQSPGQTGPQSPGAGPQSPGGALGGPPGGTRVPAGGWQAPIAPAAGAVGRPASFAARVIAAIVDAVIVVVPSIVLITLLGVGLLSGGDSDAGLVAGLIGLFLSLLVLVLVGFLYAPVLMARDGRHNGQTLGKQMMDIRVARADGRPMGFGSSALREVGVKGIGGAILASTGIGFLVIVLNYLWPLWDDENRALHDMAVNTRVVSD